MGNLPQSNQQKEDKKFMPLFAYIDNQKRKIGYAYLTQNGNLCIKGDKILDKNQLGKALINGLYVQPPQS